MPLPSSEAVETQMHAALLAARHDTSAAIGKAEVNHQAAADRFGLSHPIALKLGEAYLQLLDGKGDTRKLGECVECLRKEIGDRVLIDDLSFEVPRASVVGIVGANGAGKSTLIKMLTGQEPVTAGEVKVGGTVKLASVDQAREALDAKGGQSVFEAICGERETLDLGEREVLPLGHRALSPQN